MPCESCTAFDRERFDVCRAKGGSVRTCLTMLPCIVSTAELGRIVFETPRANGPFVRWV